QSGLKFVLLIFEGQSGLQQIRTTHFRGPIQASASSYYSFSRANPGFSKFVPLIFEGQSGLQQVRTTHFRGPIRASASSYYSFLRTNPGSSKFVPLILEDQPELHKRWSSTERLHYGA